MTGTGSKAAGTGSMEAGTGSPEAGTGSPVGSVVAGKGWKTEPASHLSHGLPPLPSAAPGSGQLPVHQWERQRSLELSWTRPIGTLAPQHRLDAFWLS